ncbi:MAG: pyridoxal 5'-phosphate synthase glutaminase subunit PdxT [Lachnospiraceae bacterium]|nr:pyridoxal 5'-phosphate synthase glutaminase subunit PdxT [Lachnospiraceae bacterium]
MTIAVVAVQGAFIEQEQRLQELGVDCIELRKKEDLEQPYDGIVLPGGESTVQGKLLKELDMFDTIHKQIQEGMPVFATCAGLILLAGELENDTRSYFKTLPVTVRRNAYGRQLGSFHTEQEVKGIGVIPMTFIRAPYISKVDSKVEVLATVEEHIVAVKYKNQLAMSFHPELDEDVRIHQKFVEMVKAYNSQSFEPLDEKIG